MSITKEEKTKLIKKYGNSDTNTGSSAAQIAILTERINAQKKYKISSTPTIIINEKKYEGKHDFDKLKKEIQKLL